MSVTCLDLQWKSEMSKIYMYTCIWIICTVINNFKMKFWQGILMIHFFHKIKLLKNCFSFSDCGFVDVWKVLPFILTSYRNFRDRPVVVSSPSSHSYKIDVCDRPSPESLLRCCIRVIHRAVVSASYINYKSGKFIHRYTLCWASDHNQSSFHYYYSSIFNYWDVCQWARVLPQFKIIF